MKNNIYNGRLDNFSLIVRSQITRIETHCCHTYKDYDLYIDVWGTLNIMNFEEDEYIRHFNLIIKKLDTPLGTGVVENGNWGIVNRDFENKSCELYFKYKILILTSSQAYVNISEMKKELEGTAKTDNVELEYYVETLNNKKQNEAMINDKKENIKSEPIKATGNMLEHLAEDWSEFKDFVDNIMQKNNKGENI